MNRPETTYDAEARIPIAVAEAYMRKRPEYTRAGGWVKGPAIKGERATSWHGLHAFGCAILRAERRDMIAHNEACDIRDGVEKVLKVRR
jgi:hypothetical protein